jgi:hypothetical protein
MKTTFLKPGFEFVFALSLIAILGLPPMLMAQDKDTKDVEIKIQNGDTTVNGKSIKNLTPAEKKDAMRDIRHISSDIASNSSTPGNHPFIMKDSVGDHKHMMRRDMIVKKDSMGNIVEMRSGKRLGKIKEDGGGPDEMGWRPGRGDEPFKSSMMAYGRRNSQSFNYVNTDNNGISTRISFNIADVTNDDLKRMPHVEGARLDITDLNVVPQFSTGKTLLIFMLPAKTLAEVKLVNSEGVVLWTEKASGGRFTKDFVMGLNGVYYLQVQQGSGVAVKRIMKEE